MARRGSRNLRSGQVLVVVIVGMAMLAGLVFYTINVGDQIHRRTEVQNAADAAAISGAAWMARSMNVIAMDNVAITRMLALVPTLDAFPLASDMAYTETVEWAKCLDRQLARGVTDDNLREGLESLKTRIVEQRDVLKPISEYYNEEFDVAELTNWSVRGYGGLPPHGELWRAAESLDLLSQATAESASVLTQRNAIRFGTHNRADVAFIAPLSPELPYLPVDRASFADFAKPVKRGEIPDRAKPQRLGPYDRLFKWRNYRWSYITVRDRLVRGDPGHGPIRGGRPNVNIGGRRRGGSAMGRETNPDDRWTNRRVRDKLLGYTTYGPYEWMRRRVRWYARGRWNSREGYYTGKLPDTFFHEYHRQIADIKLQYMWRLNPTLKEVHYPQWHTDYPDAKGLAADPNVRITKTMFYLVEIRSRYPKGHAKWMSAGSYVTNGKLPMAIWINGWEDPAAWGVPQTDNWVWEDQYTYQTTEDVDIGVKETTDATGQPIWQNVYMVAQYVFGGVDVGGEVVVTNPSNYSSFDNLPAPILMDTSVGDYEIDQPHHDRGVRREIFTYLGVAARDDTAKAWEERFDSGNPFGMTVAVAQAEIFNTASWDLWTQDWRVKLVPVTWMADWLERMEDEELSPWISAEMLDSNTVLNIQEYLSRLGGMVDEQEIR